MRYLDALGIGVQYAIGIGNGTATTAGAWLDALGNDDSVKVIGLLLESIIDWSEFRAAAQRAGERGKAIVICKTGRTEIGQSIAYSHTGALATAYAVERGGFDQIGVRVADTVNELALTLALCSRFGEPSTRTLGILGQSGGSNGQLADQCSELGIPLPKPSDATVAQIQQHGRFTAKGNPLDLADHAMTDGETFTAAVGSFFADPAFGAILFSASLDEESELHRDFLRRVQQVATKLRKPLVAVPACYTQISANTLKAFASGDDASIVAPVIDHVLSGIRTWFRVDSGQPSPPTASQAAGGRAQWRNEHDLKELLRARGALIPRNVWLPGRGSITRAQSTELARRTVVKGVGLDVHHKSRLGLVRLDVPSEPRALDKAVAAIRTAATVANVQLDGVLVEESIDGGPDLIISMARQPVGIALLIGRGGVDVENGLQRIFSILPVSDLYLTSVLAKVGVTGMIALAACLKLVKFLSDLFNENHLEELECNPVRIDQKGQAWVLDVLALGGDGFAKANSLS